MKIEFQPFTIHLPAPGSDQTARTVEIQVPCRWDELIEEWVLTEEAEQEIEAVKARELGILSPDQLRELRERHGLTKKQMGTLLQVGEKSWGRWESGKHRPTRSMNLLIRALYDGQISINYLATRAGMEELVGDEVGTQPAKGGYHLRTSIEWSQFSFGTQRERKHHNQASSCRYARTSLASGTGSRLRDINEVDPDLLLALG